MEGIGSRPAPGLRDLRRPESIAVVVVLLAVAVAVRLPGANQQLWYDEISTLLDSVRPSLGTTLTRFPGNNDHPLYSLLANLSIRAFGEAPWSVRLPALVAGVLSVPLLYAFGLTVTSRLEAATAAAVLAIAYPHVWYSQNARGYTLLLCLTLIATAALLRALEQRGFAWWLVYGACIALGGYTHLTTGFIALAHGLVAVFVVVSRSPRDHAAWARVGAGFLLAGVATLVLYAPMLRQVGAFFAADDRAAARELATFGWAMRELVRGLHLGPRALAVAPAAIVVAIGWLDFVRRLPVFAMLAVLPAVTTLAGAVAMSQPVRPRFLFALAGFAVLFTVHGAMVLAGLAGRPLPATGRRWLPALTAAALVVAAVAVSLEPLARAAETPKQDFRGALEWIEAQQRPTDVVLVTGKPARVAYQRYYGRAWEEVSSADRVREQLAHAGRVFLVYSFADYVARGTPDLWDTLKGCAVERSFPGTVGGGAVHVCMLQGYGHAEPGDR